MKTIDEILREGDFNFYAPGEKKRFTRTLKNNGYDIINVRYFDADEEVAVTFGVANTPYFDPEETDIVSMTITYNWFCRE